MRLSSQGLSLPLVALAIAAFGIGTTEFVIMGLLPDIAHDLHVSISAAGMLVAGYALGVAIGAPIMAVLTARLPRKFALLVLMSIFISGNLLCAVSGNYILLMAARVITALCHGAFFGIGSVEAADLAPEDKKASAVALMFTGLTVANVLGVPLGTALGQEAGWRSTFWVVAAIGLIAFTALARFLPGDRPAPDVDFRKEAIVLRSPSVWIALGTTVLFSASVFALFTYIAPILSGITHVSPHGISLTLLLIGLGLTAGNLVGGKIADWRLDAALVGALAATGLASLIFYWADRLIIPAEINLFIWGAAFFAAATALQVTAMNIGKESPGFISTLNIGAFNAGNAMGAWAGGLMLQWGLGLHNIPLAAVAFSLISLAAAAIFLKRQKQATVLRPAFAVQEPPVAARSSRPRG